MWVVSEADCRLLAGRTIKRVETDGFELLIEFTDGVQLHAWPFPIIQSGTLKLELTFDNS